MKFASRVGVKGAFGKVKDELDDQRETLNQLTSEVEGVYDWMIRFETVLSKLEDRHLGGSILLSYHEQEVFVLLYLSDDSLTLAELSDRLGFVPVLVERLVSSLVGKGVPILRQIHGGAVSFSMELMFKERQARENLVHIDAAISEQLVAEKSH